MTAPKYQLLSHSGVCQRALYASAKALAYFSFACSVLLYSLYVVYNLFYFVILPYWTVVWVFLLLFFYLLATCLWMSWALRENAIISETGDDGRWVALAGLLCNGVWTLLFIGAARFWQDLNKEFHWNHTTHSPYYTYPELGLLFYTFLYPALAVSAAYCLLLLYTMSRYFYRQESEALV